MDKESEKNQVIDKTTLTFCWKWQWYTENIKEMAIIFDKLNCYHVDLSDHAVLSSGFSSLLCLLVETKIL